MQPQSTRRCKKCLHDLPRDRFDPIFDQRGHHNGLHGRCRDCRTKIAGANEARAERTRAATNKTRKNAAKPRVMRRGYVQLLRPDHPDAVGGYVWEHRIVAAEMLGRALTAVEFVHHINRQRDDNRPENLQVMSRSEHRRLHWAETARHEWSMKFFACKICGTAVRPHFARGMCSVCWNATVKGLRGYARGERAANARLTPRAVIKIRERWANGETQQDLADEYGVSMSAVHLIVHRKNWKHLP